MSQHGYGHGPPQGYQPPQPYTYHPHQSYALPAYTPNEVVNSDPGQGTLAQQSYDYNRNAIPGLGLGFSSNGMVWQQEAHTSPGLLQELPSPAPTQQAINQESNMDDDSMALQGKPVYIISGDEAMEEGELSEGELEDIYEPREKDDSADKPQHPDPHAPGVSPAHHDQAGAKSSHPAASTADNGTLTQQHCGPPRVARERSGSYSPYLSPREIHSTRQGTSVPETHDTPTSGMNQQTTADSPRDIDETPSMEQRTNEIIQPTDTPVTDARKQAKEVILRLWALNVRYRNYVDEGIDKAVLNDLFTELGLDSGSASTPEVAIVPTTTQPETVTTISTPEKNETKPVPTESMPEQTKMPKDKSEERKDRIARLLAAKGSKANAPSQDISTVKATAIAPTSTDRTDRVLRESAQDDAQPPTAPAAFTARQRGQGTGPSKTQFDKSKLLQQKMEALRKSREATAKKAAQQQEATTSNTVIPPLEAPATSTAPVSNIISGPERLELPDGSSQSRAVSELEDSNAAPPIPGLFLSSTPQPPPALSQRKRPIAADLNENSIGSTHKRPFGQIRDSRPFLIDVSDDDDDAEMEIDSPEQRSSSIHRPTTPAARTASFRDYPALSHNLSSRQLSSPSAVATPTGHGGSSNGLYDLESMNRKIEDMKRKIAEAEARKKAKQSSNDSPSLSQSQQQSKEGSADPLANVNSPAARPVLTRADTDGNKSSTLPLLQNAPQPTPKHSKIREQTQQARARARSRVASERLPIVEARRQQQLAHLRQLQSEVARVEKEVQDILAEENRLREEAEVIESDSGHGEYPGGSESEAEPSAESKTSTKSSPMVTSEEKEQPPSTKESILHSPPCAEDDATKRRARSEFEVVDDQEMDEGAINSDHPTPDRAAVMIQSDRVQLNEDSDSSADDEDVAMDEADDSTGDDDSAESSDDYEPAEPVEPVAEAPSQQPLEKSPSINPAPADDSAILETTDTELQGISATVPVTQPISMAKADSMSVASEASREVGAAREASVSQGPHSTFLPYKTPLRYFRAYRFHPNFNDAFSGGLRSLTYSNKIDVQRQVCPDQLVGAECPRGSKCDFQHFESMQAPDDQILVQLGAYGNYEEEQKQQYITGLRDLLADLRNRKIKDFQSISQSIIEYRAQFYGDKTKILPLGSVSI
ncbi:Fc.00g041100.m01.CDS01 [Cosmosporella sp. VM-42]